jgi:hypothetical protein
MHLLLLNETVFKRGAPAIKAPVLHCRSLITFTNLDASGAFTLVFFSSFFYIFCISSDHRPRAASRRWKGNIISRYGTHNKEEKRRKTHKSPWRPTTELRKKEKKQSEQL